MHRWGQVSHAFSDGVYVLDLDQVWKVFYDKRRSHNYNSAKFSKVVPIDTGIPWGPSVNNIEIDFDGAAADARNFADTAMPVLCYKLSAGEYSARSLRDKLIADLGHIEAATAAFAARAVQNGKNNAKALAKNVEGWETAIQIAKGTRDASTTILAVGAAILTGGGSAGAGVALTGASSLLTGVGKVQDSTQHMRVDQAIGKVVATAGLDFCVSVVTGGIGKELKTVGWAGKSIISFVIKVPTDTVSSLIMADDSGQGPGTKDLGAHAWNAVQNWALGEAAGALLRNSSVKKLLRGIVVPVAARIKDAKSDLKGKLVSDLTKSVAKKFVKREVTDLLSAGPDKKPLPEKVVRQPVYGGASVVRARINAIFQSSQ